MKLINSSGFLAEQRRIIEIKQLLYTFKHGNDIREHRNSKTNEAHKFVLSLSQRQIRCSSKLKYLLHVEKYKKSV